MDPRHIELLNSVIRTPGRRINKERKREREREREREILFTARGGLVIGLYSRPEHLTRRARARALPSHRVVRTYVVGAFIR